MDKVNGAGLILPGSVIESMDQPAIESSMNLLARVHAALQDRQVCGLGLIVVTHREGSPYEGMNHFVGTVAAIPHLMQIIGESVEAAKAQMAAQRAKLDGAVAGTDDPASVTEDADGQSS